MLQVSDEVRGTWHGKHRPSPDNKGSEGGCAAGCGVMSLPDEADCEKRSSDTGSELRGILQGFRRQGSETPAMLLMGRISIFSRSLVLEV